MAAAATEGGGRLRLSDDMSPVRVGVGENSGDGDSGATERVTIPAGPLRHFVYHVPARRQYLAPAPPPDAAQVRTLLSSVMFEPCNVFQELVCDEPALAFSASSPLLTLPPWHMLGQMPLRRHQLPLLSAVRRVKGTEPHNRCHPTLPIMCGVSNPITRAFASGRRGGDRARARGNVWRRRRRRGACSNDGRLATLPRLARPQRRRRGQGAGAAAGAAAAHALFCGGGARCAGVCRPRIRAVCGELDNRFFFEKVLFETPVLACRTAAAMSCLGSCSHCCAFCHTPLENDASRRYSLPSVARLLTFCARSKILVKIIYVQTLQTLLIA